MLLHFLNYYIIVMVLLTFSLAEIRQKRFPETVDAFFDTGSLDNVPDNFENIPYSPLLGADGLSEQGKFFVKREVSSTEQQRPKEIQREQEEDEESEDVNQISNDEVLKFGVDKLYANSPEVNDQINEKISSLDEDLAELHNLVQLMSVTKSKNARRRRLQKRHRPHDDPSDCPTHAPQTSPLGEDFLYGPKDLPHDPDFYHGNQLTAAADCSTTTTPKPTPPPPKKIEVHTTRKMFKARKMTTCPPVVDTITTEFTTIQPRTSTIPSTTPTDSGVNTTPVVVVFRNTTRSNHIWFESITNAATDESSDTTTISSNSAAKGKEVPKKSRSLKEFLDKDITFHPHHKFRRVTSRAPYVIKDSLDPNYSRAPYAVEDSLDPKNYGVGGESYVLSNSQLAKEQMSLHNRVEELDTIEKKLEKEVIPGTARFQTFSTLEDMQFSTTPPPSIPSPPISQIETPPRVVNLQKNVPPADQKGELSPQDDINDNSDPIASNILKAFKILQQKSQLPKPANDRPFERRFPAHKTVRKMKKRSLVLEDPPARVLHRSPKYFKSQNVMRHFRREPSKFPVNNIVLYLNNEPYYFKKAPDPVEKKFKKAVTISTPIAEATLINKNLIPDPTTPNYEKVKELNIEQMTEQSDPCDASEITPVLNLEKWKKTDNLLLFPFARKPKAATTSEAPIIDNAETTSEQITSSTTEAESFIINGAPIQESYPRTTQQMYSTTPEDGGPEDIPHSEELDNLGHSENANNAITSTEENHSSTALKERPIKHQLTTKSRNKAPPVEVQTESIGFQGARQEEHKTGEHHESPGEHHESPGEHHESPGEHHESPGEHHESPGEHHESPGEHHESPGEHHESPGEHHESPGEHHESPGEHHEDEAKEHHEGKSEHHGEDEHHGEETKEHHGEEESKQHHKEETKEHHGEETKDHHGEETKEHHEEETKEHNGEETKEPHQEEKEFDEKSNHENEHHDEKTEHHGEETKEHHGDETKEPHQEEVEFNEKSKHHGENSSEDDDDKTSEEHEHSSETTEHHDDSSEKGDADVTPAHHEETSGHTKSPTEIETTIPGASNNDDIPLDMTVIQLSSESTSESLEKAEEGTTCSPEQLAEIAKYNAEQAEAAAAEAEKKHAKTDQNSSTENTTTEKNNAITTKTDQNSSTENTTTEKNNAKTTKTDQNSSTENATTEKNNVKTTKTDKSSAAETTTSEPKTNNATKTVKNSSAGNATSSSSDTTQNKAVENAKELYAEIPVNDKTIQLSTNCTNAEYMAKNHCICSVSAMRKDLMDDIKDISTSSSYQYDCSKFIRIEPGIVIGNGSESKLVRKKRDPIDVFFESITLKDGARIGRDIDSFLHQDVNIQNNGSVTYATVGSKITIPCGDVIQEDVSNIGFEWTVHNGSPETAGNKPNNGSTLVIESVVPQDTNNYTCTSIDKSNQQSQSYNHELVVVALPMFSLMVTVLLKEEDKCNPGDLEILNLYYSVVLKNILCGNGDDVCSVSIEKPQCVKVGTQEVISIRSTLQTVPIATMFPKLKLDTCDLSCQSRLYSAMAGVLLKNFASATNLAVFFRMSYRDTKLTPIQNELGDKKNTISNSILPICPAGFGIYTNAKLCFACKAYSYNPGNEMKCISCPTGSYQPSIGEGSCLSCSSPLDDTSCFLPDGIADLSRKYYLFPFIAAGCILVLVCCCVCASCAKARKNKMIGKLNKKITKFTTKAKKVTGKSSEKSLKSDNTGSTKSKKGKKVPPELPPIDF